MRVEPTPQGPWPAPADLVNIDEADRLRPNSLEQVRDMFDRAATGVVLIGISGFEKRLARQPQLYSRIGFVHSFRPLPSDELQTVLTERLDEFGLELPAASRITPDALAAIQRIASGNFRLVVRLLSQVGRIPGAERPGRGQLRRRRSGAREPGDRGRLTWPNNLSPGGHLPWRATVARAIAATRLATHNVLYGTGAAAREG